ncbi:hypothetical protein [Curtobacterium aetherium]|uniref:Uncharacterized protein n=1 Tax=Curtobacterium aetherium TaxID=2841594 RepID=A0ACD1E2B8_9MICO|nr:hypothetical protein [Curtobacterium sp. L6-1]QWS33049.1 hypothetical protein KM842_12415 [Curtobacterium sp. L6-1]
MAIDPYDLGPARVQHDQWLGTAAAEEDITTTSDDLYEVVGLDRAKWTIVGLEFFDGTSARASRVTVQALDRVKHGLLDARYEDLRAFTDSRGHLPVTSFEVHGTQVEEITKRVFKRYMVRLTTASFADTPLRVEKLGDLKLDE